MAKKTEMKVRKVRIVKAEDEFVSGAGETGQPKYPWEAPHVRDDVKKSFLLQLPEPLKLRLEFIAEQTGKSMHGFCIDAVSSKIKRELKRLIS